MNRWSYKQLQFIRQNWDKNKPEVIALALKINISDVESIALYLGLKSKRGAKYGNIKTKLDGYTFDSKGEANRWAELKLAERAGIIKDLRRQVSFELESSCLIDGKLQRATKYVADFVYTENGKTVIEDFKGHITAIYKIKKKKLLKLIAEGEIQAEFRETF